MGPRPLRPPAGSPWRPKPLPANGVPGVAPYRRVAAMTLEAYFPDLVTLRVPPDYPYPTAVVCIEGREADPEFCLDLVIRQPE